MSRLVNLIFFFLFLTVISGLGALSGDVYATASQGFAAFDSSDYDVFRYPTGVGLAYRQGGLWRGLSFTASVSWFGFPVIEGETSFSDSWMIIGYLSAGWELPLFRDGVALVAFIPHTGFGFYTRSLTWYGITVQQTRPVILVAGDAVVRTEESLVFGAGLHLTGYMDVRAVWGLSVVVSVGYAYGGVG